jgi:hypothetical protein
MYTVEQEVPRKLMSVIGFFFLLLFVPILLYGVYQSASIYTRASETIEKIIVHAANPVANARPTSIPDPVNTPSDTVFGMMHRVRGDQLDVTGTGTDIRAIAAKDGDVYRTLIYSVKTDPESSQTFPVTLQGLENGQYTSSVRFVTQADCARDDPPEGKPPHPVQIDTTETSILLCLPSHNAALWELRRLPR